MTETVVIETSAAQQALNEAWVVAYRNYQDAVQDFGTLSWHYEKSDDMDALAEARGIVETAQCDLDYVEAQMDEYLEQ